MPTPKHIVTEQNKSLVMRAVIAGMTAEQIAPIIGIAESKLWKYYKTELSNAGNEANLKVVGALFKNCMEGNVSAQIFWCKTRLGWRETSSIEVTHAQRGVISDKELSADEWDKKFGSARDLEPSIGPTDSIN